MSVFHLLFVSECCFSTACQPVSSWQSVSKCHRNLEQLKIKKVHGQKEKDALQVIFTGMNRETNTVWMEINRNTDDLDNGQQSVAVLRLKQNEWETCSCIKRSQCEEIKTWWIWTYNNKGGFMCSCSVQQLFLQLSLSEDTVSEEFQ